MFQTTYDCVLVFLLVSLGIVLPEQRLLGAQWGETEELTMDSEESGADLETSNRSQGTVAFFAAQRGHLPSRSTIPPRKWDCPLRIQRRKLPATPPRERLPRRQQGSNWRNCWVGCRSILNHSQSQLPAERLTSSLWVSSRPRPRPQRPGQYTRLAHRPSFHVNVPISVS
jgi:hypothetical protein